ncbi:MAG: sigma factor, partial [bacterium]
MRDSYAALCEGDPEEYSRLYDEHGMDLLRLATGIVWDAHEAEDIVQEAFLGLYETARRNRLKQGNSAVPGFLRRTTRNLAIDR